MIRALHPQKPKLVVIGNGMAGRGSLEDVLACDPDRSTSPCSATSRTATTTASCCRTCSTARRTPRRSSSTRSRGTRRTASRCTPASASPRIDRDAKTVYADDLAVEYDYLVFATGSKPFIPPIPGTPLHGVFAFRTLDDCRNIAEYAKDCKTAVVIGGGLLGLEAAKGLMTHNVAVTVVEMAPWLMSVQLDEAGGKVLGADDREARHHGAAPAPSTKELLGHMNVTGVKFADGTEIPADMVVISAGIRPNVGTGEGVRHRRATGPSWWTTSSARTTRPCSASASASSTTG